MKSLTYPALLLAAGLLLGCSSKKTEADQQTTGAAVADPVALESPPSASAAPPPSQEPGTEAPIAGPIVPPVPTGRLLVYHAEARVKTEAMPRASARLDSLVRSSGGFVSASTETRENGEWRQETTLRLPPARFQPLLAALGSLGTVEEKKLSTDDVTAEHADVAARLAAKRAVERQYTALLSRAQKIQDVLDVQQKLGEVREEIEATESRLKTLNDQVAYSTLTLTLYQPLLLAAPDAPVVSLGSRLVEALYDGWKLLVGLLLGAVTVWPLLLLAAGGIWLWRRRRARQLPPAGPPVPPVA